MDTSLKTICAQQAEVAVRKLKDHNFTVSYFETGKEAVSFLQSQIPSNAIVANGGSMTLSELGILDWLKGNSDVNFLDRDTATDMDANFHAALNADVYLMSSNAVTMDGYLYNVDGTGNRVAALIYGPKKVYVVCGVNKLVRNLAEAEERVKRFAAPANCVRLKKDNPCTTVGSCMNCNRPSTICNEYVVTRRSRNKERIHVILINENYGY